jgi:hypothetical protein
MKLSSLTSVSPLLLTALGCSSATEEDPPTPHASSYHRDVKPLLEQHCVECHRSGGIAPFPLTTFEEVAARAASIAFTVESRTMPPWQAGPDCTDYAGDISLRDDEIATISSWVSDGAPAGEETAPATSPPKPAGLARVDLTVALPSAYTPVKSPDEHRCFVFDWTGTTTKFITGLDVHPGAPSVVHHALIFVAKPSGVEEVRSRDAADPGLGYDCFGSAGSTTHLLGGWVPGSSALSYPANTGIEIEPGSVIVVQIHYNTASSSPVPDTTSVDFSFADSVATKAAMVSFLDPAWPTLRQMNIPARTADVVHRYSADPAQIFGFLSDGLIQPGRPLTFHLVAPHMHTRGSRIAIALEHTGGRKECLLEVPRWDFAWQRTYTLASPKVLQPGESMTVECHWNNTGDTDLNWGE